MVMVFTNNVFIFCVGQPVTVPAITYSTPYSSLTCHSEDIINKESRKARATILLDFFKEKRPCSCGGPGWTEVAHLDMSDTNQQCPSNWRLVTSPVRGCGRLTSFSGYCDSVVVYPLLPPVSYSSVCGRIIAYQKGQSYGFEDSLISPQDYLVYFDIGYLSGLSVTHGPPGNRKHIWSFVGAESELNTANPLNTCPCTNTDIAWPFKDPYFVGTDYFCDTGNKGLHNDTQYYTEDPLWDGKGCGPTSTCCTFNSPPWFCKSLPQRTNEVLEIRLCNLGDEDKIVTQIDIYIK